MWFTLLFALQTTHVSSDFDFWINKWVDAGNMTYNNSQQIAGINSNAEIFYLLGGRDKISDGIYMYNPYNMTYEGIKPYSTQYTATGQTYVTINQQDGSSYLYFDTYDPSGRNKDNFYALNLQNQKLNTIGKPSGYGLSEDCYVYDGQRYIYSLGGYPSPYYTGSSFLIFDTSDYEWHIGPPMPGQGWSQSGCVLVANQLFVFGGVYNNHITMLNMSSKVQSWSILNVSLTDENPYGVTAIYPVFNMKTMDNYISNTVFIFADQFCNKFNYRTHAIQECNQLPPVLPGAGDGAYIYAYVGNEFRIYVFGGHAVGNKIQYALLESNITFYNNSSCSWKANNGNNTLDLNNFMQETIVQRTQSNENVFYRYTPCRNSLMCNNINEMVDLFSVANGTCDRYLSVWDDMLKHQVFYDIDNKSWQFIYTNGKKCNGLESILNIIWKCNTKIKSYNVTFANSLSQCHDQIVIESNFACD
eukprot:229719_1